MENNQTTAVQVYTTEISEKIQNSFNYWRNQKVGTLKRTQAFLNLSHLCEKENKKAIDVIDQLSKY